MCRAIEPARVPALDQAFSSMPRRKDGSKRTGAFGLAWHRLVATPFTAASDKSVQIVQPARVSSTCNNLSLRFLRISDFEIGAPSLSVR